MVCAFPNYHPCTSPNYHPISHISLFTRSWRDLIRDRPGPFSHIALFTTLLTQIALIWTLLTYITLYCFTSANLHCCLSHTVMSLLCITHSQARLSVHLVSRDVHHTFAATCTMQIWLSCVSKMSDGARLDVSNESFPRIIPTILPSTYLCMGYVQSFKILQAR